MTFSPRQRALTEVVGFTILLVVTKLLFDLVTWRFSGPLSLLATLALLAAYRRAQAQPWSNAGLRSLPGIGAKLWLLPQVVLGLVAILGTGVGLSVLAEHFHIAFLQQNMDAMATRLGPIQGDLPRYLLWLAVSWLSAGLGEELFFRGFVISRLADAFAGWRLGRTLAVLLAALLFGACHVYYQGVRGLVVGGAIGLALGTLFFAYKRNLWPLMIAHALVDSLAVTAHYLNWDV